MLLGKEEKQKNKIWTKPEKGIRFMLQWAVWRMHCLTERVKQYVYRGACVLQGNEGMTVIELLLILVVIIALVLLFKNNLINLVNTIFQKITSESAGI